MIWTDKTILVDADGVLLDWMDKSFTPFIESKGYTKVCEDYRIDIRYGISEEETTKLVLEHNNSTRLLNIAPLRDAVSGIKRLSEMGYRFICISSVSLDPLIQDYRTSNLISLFGSVFDDFIYLDTGERKHQVLEHFMNSDLYWIEDNYQNAYDGWNVGLRPILVEHPFTHDLVDERMTKVNTWNDIVTHIAENP